MQSMSFVRRLLRTVTVLYVCLRGQGTDGNKREQHKNVCINCTCYDPKNNIYNLWPLQNVEDPEIPRFTKPLLKIITFFVETKKNLVLQSVKWLLLTPSFLPFNFLNSFSKTYKDYTYSYSPCKSFTLGPADRSTCRRNVAVSSQL